MTVFLFTSLAFKNDFNVEILPSLTSAVLGWGPRKSVYYLWRISSKNGELPCICHIPTALAKVEPELRQLYIGSNIFIDESTLSNPGECLCSSYQNLADAEGFFFSYAWFCLRNFCPPPPWGSVQAQQSTHLPVPHRVRAPSCCQKGIMKF